MKKIWTDSFLKINSIKKHKKISQPHEGGGKCDCDNARHKSGGDDIDINDDESFTIWIIPRVRKKSKRYLKKNTKYCELFVKLRILYIISAFILVKIIVCQTGTDNDSEMF